MGKTFQLPDGYDTVVAAGHSRPAPEPAAYVCKIINTDLEDGRLKLELDIAEGDFADYFKDDFDERKARGLKFVYWSLTASIPIAFDDPKNGEFFQRLYKRFDLNVTASNPNFELADNRGVVDIDKLIGKHIGALIIVKEKEVNRSVYRNYRVEETYTVKEVHEGKTREAWIVGVDGSKRKPGEPAPVKRDAEGEPVDDVDIPF